MSSAPAATAYGKDGVGGTMRKDRWWIEPSLTGFGFLVFVIYSTWAAFQGEHYYHGPYLSPFYSPLLFVDTVDAVAGGAPTGHAWFGAWPEILPGWIPKSPALLILAGPLSFRATCYYYRKFYYRSYFVSPPACAVGGVSHDYRGETRLFVIQNLHRYALPFALLLVVILSYDGWMSLWRGGELGVGVGSIILIINPILIAGYTFGCHSFRHFVGGNQNSLSQHKCRKAAWEGCSKLNSKHQQWAWASLIWVAWSDVYVRLVSTGVITDLNTWN